MKYYFIIHGFMGSNIENWFPWLKEKIDKEENKCCIVPQFPIELKFHNYASWAIMMDTYKGFNTINENTTLIGHSTGSIFIVKYIIKNKIKVKKLILVSGFNNYYDPVPEDIHNTINPTYYISDEELKELHKYTDEIVCMYGDNDPYIPQKVLHGFATTINAKEIIIPNGGHINTSSGYNQFIEILEEL